MNHLLIIDDSKSIIETIKFTIEQSNKFLVHTAMSFAEAKKLILQQPFDAAIVDINLPDCEEGDAVALTTSKGIPSIVLTGKIDEQLRKKIYQYKIVDYLIKQDSYSIESAVLAAETLLAFRGQKVLTVDISNTSRKLMKNYFERLKLEVVEASNAEDALKILELDKHFKIIITESNLPKMSAVDFLKKLRQMDFSSFPIIYAIGSSDNENAGLLLLKSGVHDYFTKPFQYEKIYPKIANALQTREQEDTLKRYLKTVDKYVITSETDVYGNITYASDAFCQISGYSKDELLGKNHNIVRHPDMPKELYQELWSTITSGQSWSGEVKNLNKNDSSYWVDVNIDPMFDDTGKIMGYRAIRQDITDKKRIEELSLTDAMTGLFNRRYFTKHLSNMISIGQRENIPVAMILLDVDHFKQYNDTYGHQKGDDVLIAIGSTIKYICKRGGDVPFRIGGEEFCVISYNTTAHQAEVLANKTREAIEELHILHEKNSTSDYVTASFGVISTSKDSTLDMEAMYAQSDNALYQAKEHGRNQVHSL